VVDGRRGQEFGESHKMSGWVAQESLDRVAGTDCTLIPERTPAEFGSEQKERHDALRLSSRTGADAV